MIGYTNGETYQTFFSRGYGQIIQDKRGTNGMNYDLIFYVPKKNKTLAELTHKEQVAVWGDAWDKLATHNNLTNPKTMVCYKQLREQCSKKSTRKGGWE